MEILLALLLGGGLLFLVVGLLYRPPARLAEIDRVMGRGETTLSLGAQLQAKLDGAGIQARPHEFVLAAAGIGSVTGGALVVLVGAPFLGLVGFGLGVGAYWFYLTAKAEETLARYEEELPAVVSRLISGAQVHGGAIGLAAEHVARFGPTVVREDWAYISAQLRGGANLPDPLRVVAERRRSHLLNALFELLLLVQETRRPLVEVLGAVQPSLEERVGVIRKARTKLRGPILRLWITASITVVIVIEMRLILPGASEIYASLPGQLLLGLIWGLVLILCLKAHQGFAADLRRHTSVEAELPAEPRTRLRAEAPAPAAVPGAAIPGAAVPGALAGVVGGSTGRADAGGGA